tara:strand:- start:589 stop:1101 length:513 start_codon:yes stop_codon:yes gene_type:complete
MEKIERKFAPLLKWAEKNEGDESKEDSIYLINLNYRRLVKDPKNHVRLWRQMVDEGESAGHKDWPIARGPTSKLPTLVLAECNSARIFAETQATAALVFDENVKYQKLKRPHEKDPLLHNNESFVKAHGKTAFDARRRAFTDGHMFINDNEQIQYRELSIVGQDDKTEEE